jgi:hypothetical protein
MKVTDRVALSLFNRVALNTCIIMQTIALFSTVSLRAIAFDMLLVRLSRKKQIVFLPKKVSISRYRLQDAPAASRAASVQKTIINFFYGSSYKVRVRSAKTNLTGTQGLT